MYRFFQMKNKSFGFSECGPNYGKKAIFAAPCKNALEYKHTKYLQKSTKISASEPPKIRKKALQ